MKFLFWNISKLPKRNKGVIGTEIDYPKGAQIVLSTKSGFDVLASSLALAGDIEDVGLAYAKSGYGKLVTAASILILMILCEYGINLTAGWIETFSPGPAQNLYDVDFFIGLVSAFFLAVRWWMPEKVAWVTVAGGIIGELNRRDPKHGGLSKGAKWFIEEYDDVFQWLLLICTVSGLFLGIVPFGAHPIAFFVLILGAIPAHLLSVRYKEQLHGTLLVEFLYYSILVTAGCYLLSLIPTSSWGAETSLTARFVHGLISNIRGGLFPFGILLSLALVFSNRRSRAPKDNKGSVWGLIILWGLLEMMYMPMQMFVDAYKGADHAPKIVGSQPAIMLMPAVYQKSVQILHVVPGESFQKAEIPQGTKVIENVQWDCPQRCILEVEHDGDRLCEVGSQAENIGGRLWYLGVYKNLSCRVTTVDIANNRDREQFFMLPGVNDVDFPKNLVHVISSFGTDEYLGPVEVRVTTTTRS